MLKDNISWMRKMWLGDNCHTLDRHVFEAQLDCGIGRNQYILSNATEINFKVTYYEFIQGDNEECMNDFIYDSNKNIFYSSAMRTGVTLAVAVAALVSFA